MNKKVVQLSIAQIKEKKSIKLFNSIK